MPLRDHFHPPLSEHRRWEGFHAMWPGTIVRHLLPTLPEGFYAEPRVRLGTHFEVDVGTLDTRDEREEAGGGTATLSATTTALAPTWTVDAELDEFDEFAVEIYQDNQTLVAAIEIVSERNKDRPEARADLASKVASLLRAGVCVSIIDVVTNRHFNLYADGLDWLGLTDPTIRAPMPYLYAATVRRRPGIRRRSIVDTWFLPLAVAQPLPSLPIWLNDTTPLILDLESSYEETCRTLRIE